MITDLFNSDVTTCGNKAASLGKLKDFGFCVPQGCVVQTENFVRHLEKSSAMADVLALNKTLSVSQPNCREATELASRIRASIEATPLCVDLQEKINRFVKQRRLARLVIRSSSVAEDTSDQSWAGQYDSFLDVSIEQVPIYLKRCWSSAFSDRVLAYSNTYSGDVTWPPMAVIIQELVPSQVSGVGFSLHPVTGKNDHIVIEAVMGLGESLVSGTANPEHFVLEGNVGAVIEHRRASVDEEDHGDSLLNDLQLKELCSLIKAVEKCLEMPCDIEWSLVGSKLHLLQARPITVRPNLPAQSVSNSASRRLMVSHQSDLLTQDVVLTGVKLHCDFREFEISFPYPFIRYDHSSGDISYPTSQVNEFEASQLSIVTLDRLVEFLSKELDSYEAYLHDFSAKSSIGPTPGLIKEFFDKTLRSAGTIPYFICFEIAVNNKMAADGFIISQVKSSPTATTEADSFLRSLSKKYEFEIANSLGKGWISDQMRADLDEFCNNYAYLGMLYFKGSPWTTIDAFKMLLSLRAETAPAETSSTPDTPILEIASRLLTLRTRKWEIMCYGCSLFRSHVIQHYGHLVNYEDLLSMRIAQVCSVLDGQINANSVATISTLFVLEITEDGVVISEHSTNCQLSHVHSASINGICANPGVANGVARIVLSARNCKNFSSGDILVTKMSTPDFLPLMRKAAAFVTEIGGVTSHAAILSRELGVPCIIGATNATSIIQDGDLLSVDANTGRVTISKNSEIARLDDTE